MTNTLESLTLQILDNANQVAPQIVEDFLMWQLYSKSFTFCVFLALSLCCLGVSRYFWNKFKKEKETEWKIISIFILFWAGCFLAATTETIMSMCKIKYYPNLYIAESIFSKK